MIEFEWRKGKLIAMLTIGEHLALWRNRHNYSAKDIAGNKSGYLTRVERNQKVKLPDNVVEKISRMSNEFNKNKLKNPTSSTILEKKAIMLISPFEAVWLKIKYESSFKDMSKKTNIAQGTLSKIANQCYPPNPTQRESLEKIIGVSWNQP